jgi:hypothetical protein
MASLLEFSSNSAAPQLVKFFLIFFQMKKLAHELRMMMHLEGWTLILFCVMVGAEN